MFGATALDKVREQKDIAVQVLSPPVRYTVVLTLRHALRPHELAVSGASFHGVAGYIGLKQPESQIGDALVSISNRPAKQDQVCLFDAWRIHVVGIRVHRDENLLQIVFPTRRVRLTTPGRQFLYIFVVGLMVTGRSFIFFVIAEYNDVGIGARPSGGQKAATPRFHRGRIASVEVLEDVAVHLVEVVVI